MHKELSLWLVDSLPSVLTRKTAVLVSCSISKMYFYTFPIGNHMRVTTDPSKSVSSVIIIVMCLREQVLTLTQDYDGGVSLIK